MITKEYLMCLEQWQWLAATGGSRDDFFNWLKLQRRENEFESNCGCWACEVFKSCRKCPLKYCSSEEHLYNLWARSIFSINKRKYYARQMIKLIKQSEIYWTNNKSRKKIVIVLG